MTEEVRRAVLAYLGRGADPRFSRHYVVANVHQQTGCSETEVWEALWGLVGEGLLYLDTAGQQSSTDNWRWCLSADGRHVVKGGTWEPRDPEGYLARVGREIPDLDDLVALYITEALRSFNGRSYLAMSVMLGVAAERAFLVMAETYGASSVAGAPAIAKELAKRGNYFALWTEFRKRIEPVRQVLPNGLADGLTLDAVADLIRLTRNEVGHPTGRQIDEDTARVHLTIAPVYLRTKTQATVPVETLASMSGRRSALRTGQVAVETGAVLGLDVVAFAGSVRDQGGRGAPQLPSGPNAANAEARKRFANLRHPSGIK